MRSMNKIIAFALVGFALQVGSARAFAQSNCDHSQERLRRSLLPEQGLD